jgi:hypothetical protein
MKIKNFDNKVLFESEGSPKEVIEKAVKEKVSLCRANLSGAYLGWANLNGADLREANLGGAYLPDFQICPEEGDFVAYKKTAEAIILKLLIPPKALRTTSLIGRKCRASQVVVLEAINSKEKIFTSIYDKNFKYTVGQTITLTEPFNPDIRLDCTSGIHFFMTKKEAERF